MKSNNTKYKKMQSTLKKILWLFIGIVIGVGVALHWQSRAFALNEPQKTPLPVDELKRFALVFDLIKNNYVEDVDEKKVLNDAIAGMVSGLDPHSQYMTAKEYKEFEENFKGSFIGLGIEITKDDMGIKVVAPIEGSPAERKGLLAGDIITAIDGDSAQEMSLVSAMKKMRGEEGTKIKLKIYRQAEQRSFDVEIVREPIVVKSVKSKILEPGYAWLRVSNFQENTLTEFAENLKKIATKEPLPKGLILDLRNNPGGLLYDAIGMVAAFVPENVVVVTTKGKQDGVAKKYLANKKEYLPYLGITKDPLAGLPQWVKTVPVVVLVNEGSASASEIVAGALRDHKRALVMGRTTFGKGSVQNLQQLPGKTALKLTIARYYTPHGTSIQAKGIEPDIELDDFAQGSPYALLRTREADLSKHLANGDEKERQQEKQLQQQREELLKKLEQDSKDGKLLKYPELGSKEDFPLQQVLNQLKGLPVVKAKVVVKDTQDKATDAVKGKKVDNKATADKPLSKEAVTGDKQKEDKQ